MNLSAICYTLLHMIWSKATTVQELSNAKGGVKTAAATKEANAILESAK